jgi:hypothetical protein
VSPQYYFRPCRGWVGVAGLTRRESARLTAAFDQDLAVAGVRISHAFLMTAVELAGASLLAVERFYNFVRLAVP